MKTSLLLIICMFQMGLAQTPFGTKIDSLIRRGIDFTFQSEFDSAMTLYREIESGLPDHPVGAFYQAATLQSAMMDYETDQWESGFFHHVDRAILLGESKLTADKSDPWVLFYLGNAYGYKGLYLARKGSYVAGFRSAHKGIGLLEEAVALDSTLYDPYLLIGNYKYWSGRFYKFIRWLPFVRDERELGLELIRKSIRQGSFSRWVGLNSLGWIEYDRKAYAEALTLFEEGLTAYPDSRFFLWGVGAAHQQLEQWAEANDYHEELLLSILSGLVNNGYNEAEVRKKLMLAYFALNEVTAAKKHAEAILALEVEESVEKRIKDHRKQARRILQNKMVTGK